MSKRLLCLLLAAVMIVGMMPAMFVQAEEANTETLSFVGKGETTGGDWVGKYGKDGYFLPFYTLYEKYDKLVKAENPEWVLSSGTTGRYTPVAGTSGSGTRYTLEAGVSLDVRPSYVSAMAEVATGNGYWVDATSFQPTDNPLAPQNPRGGATTRNLSYVRSGTNMAYKFTMNDDAWHYVTVYAVDYAGKYSATYSVIEGNSENGTRVASYSATVDELAAGVYLTFKVKGAFVLRADYNNTTNISGYCYINGIFFDAVPTAGDGDEGDVPEQTVTATKVGMDLVTKGAWEDKYGKEAAILYGYKAPLSDTTIGEKTEVALTVDESTLILKSEDSSLTSIESDLGGTHVFWFKTHPLNGTTEMDDDEGVLDLPKSMQDGNEQRLMYAVGRIRKNGQFPQFISNAYGVGDKIAEVSIVQTIYTLNMADNEVHNISLYGYECYPQRAAYVTLFDLEGNILLTDTINPGAFAGGAYLTYQVDGSVKIVITVQDHDNGYKTGFSGIFIDPVANDDEEDPGEGGGEGGGQEPAVPGMLRIDTVTKGAWEDNYGLDSAILFGYKYDASNMSTTQRTSVNKDSNNLMVDTIETPYYSDFALDPGGNLGGYGAQDGDATVLTMPDVAGAGRTAFNAYAKNAYVNEGNNAVDGLGAGKYYGRIIIQPKDTNPHILTLYSNREQKEEVHVRIVDELGNLLAEDTIPAGSLTGGCYVSFPLQAKTADKNVYIYYCTDSYKSVGFNALFLDTLQNVASNLAVTGEAGDGAKLTWTNSAASAGCQTQIQRSEDNGATWNTIAAVSGTTYTDPGLTPGKTYTYRASTVFGTMESGVYTNTVSYTAEEPPAAETLSFVGKSSYTGGDWVGKVGAEGYFLPFYTVYEVFHPLTEGENATYMYNDNNKYVPVASNPTGSPNRLTLLEDVSLASWPSYMGKVYEFGTQNGYVVEASKGNFLPGHEITAPQDPREGMTTRNKTYVRANPGLGFKFNFTDDEWHYMTVYAATYNYQSTTTYSVIEGTNESAAPVASYTATREELKAGVYMTFKVKGSFVLKATMATGSDAAFINGIFFDAIPVGSDVSNLQAEQNENGVKLSWNYSGTESITVQRRVTGTESWEAIGNTAAGATSFVDRTVETGVSYDYRVASHKGILPTEFTDSVTIAVTVEVQPPFAFVGTGVLTGGDWIGKVGSEGYFLPFYTIFGAYGEIASGRYDSNTTECTGWSLQDKSSLIALGDGIAITAEDGTHNGYYIGDKAFRVTTDGRAPQDPREGATTRNMTYVRSDPRLSYSFNMPEDEAYYVTIYTTDYSDSVSADFKLMILNSAGTEVLAERVVTIEDLNKGVYNTFKVTGDFKLKLEGTAYVFMNGVFFDKAPEWEVSDFEVTDGASVRSAKLSWSCDKAVVIERKVSGADAWERIAVVEAGIGTYTDSNLDACTTYTYRLAATNKVLLGAYSEEKSITTVTYAQTVLTTEQQSYTVTVGQTMDFSGQLKKADGTALTGKEIYLTLAGNLVDEGFVRPGYGVVVAGNDGTFSVRVFDLPVGSYELTLRFMPDDDNDLAQSSAVVRLEIVPVAWETAPKALSVSDGVAPGEYFSINGYGFNIGTPEVRIGTGAVEDATALTIAQYDETDGYFIQLQLPKTMAAGTYKLWVKNDHGWSEPVLLNAARPLFISENSAWAGQIIEISGRNLLGSQYKAADATAVRLVGTAGTYVQTITENSPYKIAFAVKDAPAGDYTVEVTNDGVNWAPLSSGQILSVVAAGKDPLGLGVAWADVYKWDNQISVLDHGATGNDTTDDTAAIQAAVNAAAVNGGVVYLPAGNYYVSRIAVPAHVVILGEGMDKTYLYYNGTDGKYMIESVGTGANVGYQGFAQFTIRLADANYQPDTYFWIGYPWGGNTLDNKYARENKYYFLYEVGIDTDPVLEGSNRGLGVVPIVGEHFLMQSCRFVGDMAVPSSGYVTAYASMRDCYLEFSQGVPQMNSSYTFVEDTDVIIHYETGRDSHGITVRDNSHVEDCYVYGAGGGNKNNDGETILAEATSFYDYGSVVSVDGNKILLNGTKTNLSDFKLRWGDVAIMITDGKGIGQYRYVDMSRFDWSNPSATEFYVAEPWDIEPDGTSKYTLVAMIENVTFYRNKTEDGVKGIWFYGNVNDGVIAENTSIDTEGIFAYSSQQKRTSRHTVSYRTTIRDNELYGVARQSNRVGIFTHAQRGGVQGEYVAVSVYALDVKDNRIYGDATKNPVSMNETPRHSGIVISSCEISSDPNCLSELGQADTANVIVQGNQLFNLKEGVLVTSCTYGTVIANNYFEDVQNKLVKLSVDTAKVAQPLMLMSDISDAAQTQPECTDHLWLEGENCQVCGWCGIVKAAQIGDTIYATIGQALNAAQPGQTVKLVADTQATDVVLTKGIDLDLNGYDLTAVYVVAFAGSEVIDGAGDGLLKCANVSLNADNSQMPVWDDANNAKGYRFFDMVKYQQYKTQDANGFVFQAKPALGKAANDRYLEAMDSNRLTVKARIYWKTTSENEVEQLFTFKPEDVAAAYQADNMVLQLTVTGAGAYAGKLWTSIRIESETGVIWEGVDAQPYTGISGQ